MDSDVSNEVWEIAKDLYDNDEIDCDVNRYGQVEDVSFNMEYDEYNEYYQDCNEADFEKAKEYLKQLLIDTKYYTDYKRYLELSDNHTFWDIEVPEGKQLNYDDEYGFVYDQALSGLSKEIGTDVYGLGRSGRHICVDDTFENLTKLNDFKVAQAKWEKWFIDAIETQLKTEDDKMTESLHNGEMSSNCLNCGKTIIYTKRDICNDIDGDYIECPSCHATFDVECNNDKCEVSESKEEANTDSVIKESLNTGVLNIIDVDMYSINDRIPESATQEGLDEIVQDIAPKYLKEVIQEVLPSVEIYAEGVYHPKQYNYSGDELEFELVANKEEYEALRERVTSDANFNAFLKNNYKSYDGFVSYMADDISEFGTQDTWKQLAQVIMFALKDKVDLEAINSEYLDEFLDRVHTEFGWDDEEDDLEESKKEELFNNDINSSVNTEDKSSNLNESKNYKVELTSGGYGAISNTSGRKETIYLTAENSDEAMNKGLDIAEKEGLGNCIVEEIKEPVVFDVRYYVEPRDTFNSDKYCHIKANTKEDAINYFETELIGKPILDNDGNYTKKSYGKLISCEISQYPSRNYEYRVTESKGEEKEESESNKKEELFDNNINASISTGDISSNIDLGGLDDLLGMTEAKILDAKNNIKYDEVEYNKANKEVNN